MVIFQSIKHLFVCNAQPKAARSGGQSDRKKKPPSLQNDPDNITDSSVTYRNNPEWQSKIQDSFELVNICSWGHSMENIFKKKAVFLRQETMKKAAANCVLERAAGLSPTVLVRASPEEIECRKSKSAIWSDKCRAASRNLWCVWGEQTWLRDSDRAKQMSLSIFKIFSPLFTWTSSLHLSSKPVHPSVTKPSALERGVTSSKTNKNIPFRNCDLLSSIFTSAIWHRF